MKKRSNIFTSGLLVAGLFLTALTFAQAQSNAAWTTSKGVQKVANKQLFNDEDLQKSHIQATSVSSTWNISKGVHQQKNSEVTPVNIIASENPSWVISKDVQRMNVNESAVAKREDASKDDIKMAGNK
jgi:hypothetical protein